MSSDFLMPAPRWRRALPRIGLDEESDLPVGRLAAQLAAAGERGAAAEAYREILAASPGDVEVLEKLAAVLARLGRVEEEIEIRRRIAAEKCERLGVPPEHREAAIAFEMASLGVAEAPAAAPDAYVAASFDALADTFDHRLGTILGYRAPELVMARVARAFGAASRRLDVCDLGCGTGLLGPPLRPFARALAGVDLSPRMLDKARARGVYDELAPAEISAFLADRAGAYDLVTAADVLVYVGDLGPILAAVARSLRAGGIFVFTVERAEADGYLLHGGARYAHSAAYVRAAAAAAGLVEVSIEEDTLRAERGVPVRGLVCVLRRE